MRFVVPLLILSTAASVKGQVVPPAANTWQTATIDLLKYSYNNYCDGGAYSSNENCSLTQGYWGTHYDGAKNQNKDIDWPGLTNDPQCIDVFRLSYLNYIWNESNLHFMDEERYYVKFYLPQGSVIYASFFQATEESPLDVIRKGESQADKNGFCYIVARQYIATLINFCNKACTGFCPSGVDCSTTTVGEYVFNRTEELLSGAWTTEPENVIEAMILSARFLFSDDCQSDPNGKHNVSTNVQLAHTILDEYNNGVQIIVDGECVQKYGPPHCEDRDDNSTNTCQNPPDDCPVDTCEGGCTFTQGFWKTHRLSTKVVKGKKGQSITGTWGEVCPYDFLSSVDGMVCADGVCSSFLEQTQYYLIPQFTWAEVLDHPAVGGEACLIAAKQLIAAELNHHCGGACVTAKVQDVMDRAKAIMTTECVDMTVDSAGKTVDGLDASVNNPNSTSTINRRKLLGYAEYLDGYNNGFNIGPGHCGDSSAELLAALAVEPETIIQTELTKQEKNDGTFGMVIAILCIVGVMFLWKIAAAIWYCARGGASLERGSFERGFEKFAAAKMQPNSHPNLRQRYGRS